MVIPAAAARCRASAICTAVIGWLAWTSQPTGSAVYPSAVVAFGMISVLGAEV